MKILLVNPPNNLKKVIGAGTFFVPAIEPLGLLYIATVCKNAGYEIYVVDAYAENLDKDNLTKRIEQIAPDIIGFTSFTSNGGFLYEYGKYLKTNFPESFIIFGNTHASVYAEQYLKNGCCDAVVHGDGEFVFLDLIKYKEGEKRLEAIGSVSILNKGKYITASRPSVIKDLSCIPIPDRSLVKSDLYSLGKVSNMRLAREPKGKTSKHMFTSRGCYNNCHYCTVNYGGVIRYNTVENSISEMEELMNRYNAGYIFFMDSLFTSKKERVIEICKEIKKRNLKFRWGCEAGISSGIDEELIENMESAGCTDMNFGIESGVQRLLNCVNKNIKLEEVKKIIELVKKRSKINASGLFILGLPGERYEDSLETIRFAKALPLDMAQFSILTPYPGSPLFNDLARKGEIDTGIKKDGSIDVSVWERYSLYISYTKKIPIWTTKEQTGEGLKYLQKKALRSFYLRPRTFWKQLKRIDMIDIFKITKVFISTFLAK
ncbi:MAG: B12-binding domain-containing radical SAM protein [Elusimicrobia bacterium]|nr:B12-binding domain-containing radical SAM protein [Candidatus Liberimonas magnetica]